MMRPKLLAPILLAALLLAPTAPSAAAAATATAEDPVTMLHHAAHASARADWSATSRLLADARAGLADLPRPDAGPGADLDAALERANESATARDAAGLAVAVARARAAVAHASFAAARASLDAPDGALDLALLPQSTAWERQENDLDALAASLAAAPGDATLRVRVHERLLDRVAETARVEMVLAQVAFNATLPDAARAHAHAALDFARALDDEAQARFPRETRDAWRDALDAWASAADAPTPDAIAEARARLHPLLLALGLARTINALDMMGDAVLVRAVAVEHAARFGGPALVAAARDEMLSHWRVHDRALFLAGEGDIEPLARNLTALAESAHRGAAADALRDDVRRARDNLRALAHLGFGSFSKLSYVHVEQGELVNFTLVAGRFPLDGVRAWEARVRFDPAIAAVEAVHGANPREVQARWDNDAGWLIVRAEAESPIAREAVLANLVFRGVGAPLTETPLAFDAFTMTSGGGDAVEIFLARDGRVKIALIDAGPLGNVSDDPYALTNPALARQDTPAPSLVGLALALAAAAALLGQRRPPTGGGCGDGRAGGRDGR